MLTVQPEDCAAFVRAHSDHGGADVVLEVAGADSTFRLSIKALASSRCPGFVL